MTDPRTIDHYAFLTMGIGFFAIGAWTTYLAVFGSHSIDRSLRLRGVLGGPALIVIGAYLVYFTAKHGRDVVEAGLSRDR